MKSNPLLCAITGGILAGCSTPSGSDAPRKDGAFAEARGVIERNCVQCHGKQKLAGMPSFGDTRALAALRGPGNWIVPGEPEKSRFFLVVTLPDSQPGAMPPTGHAISKEDVAKLRAWIAAGAPLPAKPMTLTPQGIGPRSL
jgi:mono/diheme cytochrome c family protein